MTDDVEALKKSAQAAYQNATWSDADLVSLIAKLRSAANAAASVSDRADLHHHADALHHKTQSWQAEERRSRAKLAEAAKAGKVETPKPEPAPKPAKRRGLLSLPKAGKKPKPVAPTLEEVVHRICNSPVLSTDEIRKLLRRAGVLDAAAGAPYEQLVARVQAVPDQVVRELHQEADQYAKGGLKILALLQA